MYYNIGTYTNEEIIHGNTTITPIEVNLTFINGVKYLKFRDVDMNTETISWESNVQPQDQVFIGVETISGSYFFPVSTTGEMYTQIPENLAAFFVLEKFNYEIFDTTIISIFDRLGNKLATGEFTESFTGVRLDRTGTFNNMLLSPTTGSIRQLIWNSDNIPEDGTFLGLSFNQNSNVVDVPVSTSFTEVILTGNVSLYEVYEIPVEPEIVSTVKIFGVTGTLEQELNTYSYITEMKLTAVGATKTLYVKDGEDNELSVSWDSQSVTPNETFKGLSFNNYSSTADIVVGEPYKQVNNLTGNVLLYEKYESIVTDRFTVNLYRNSAEHIRVDKTNFLEYVGEIHCVMLNGSSITNLTIEFEWNGVPNFNYVYISSFNRYYFVNDIRTVRYNLWSMSLSVDVLMTYRNKIYECTAFVSRNETVYNPMIYDSCLPMEQGINVTEYTAYYTPFVPIYGRLTLNQLGDIYTRYEDSTDPAYNDLASSGEYGLSLQSCGCRVAFVTTNIRLYDGVTIDSLETNTYNFLTEYDREWFDIKINPRYVGSGSRVYVGNLRSLIEFFNTLNSNNIWDILTNAGTVGSGVNKILIFPNYLREGDHKDGFKVASIKSGPDTYLTGDLKLFPLFDYDNGTYSPIYLMCSQDIYGEYGDFRDYGMYTKIKAYLPYVGYVNIPTDYVMNKKLVILLQIDYKTGMGMYYVCVTDENDNLDNYNNCRIISKHIAKIALEIDGNFTSTTENARNQILSLVKTAAAVGFAAAGYPTASAVVSNVGTNTTEDVSESRARGDYKGARMKTVSTTNATQTQNINTTKTTKYYKSSSTIANDIISGVQSALAPSSHYSSVETNESFLEGIVSPYVKILIETPKYPDVGDYETLCGKPLNSTGVLNDLIGSGYTEISVIHLENFDSATDVEIESLNEILTRGIIL